MHAPAATALLDAPSEQEFRRTPEPPAAEADFKPETDAATPANPAPEALPERLLSIDAPAEPRGLRLGYLALAIVVALGFFWVMQAYWAPAHPGIDQNGYLVGGRVFAKTLSTGYKPDSPFQYVGGMWVLTDDGWVYPKYPLGVPILTAVCLWIGGETHGPMLTYLVSPVCASAALLATFFLVREIAGSFAGVLSQLLLAANPIMLSMANNPWSHAPALGFTVAGMAFLVWWWRYDGLWRGAIAGFLLGYAVMIRYTEGLLLLPMAVVALSKVRWRDWRSYARCATPLLSWLIPVGYLLIFNKLAMGAWTGYDATNESTGFQLDKLLERWPSTIELFYDSAAYFIFPIGVLGLLLMFCWNWRVGLFLAAWLLPGAAVYTSYYWGGNARLMGELRFYLTLLPPVLAAACWVMGRAGGLIAGGRGEGAGAAGVAGGIVQPLAIGVIVAIACVAGLRDTIPQLERDFTINTNLADSANVLRMHARGLPAAEGVLFTDGQQFMSGANYLQFATGFEVYGVNAFANNAASLIMRGPGGGGGEGDPNPLQAKRREYLRAEYAKYDDAGLVAKQNEVMRNALARGKRIFVLLPANEADAFERRYLKENFASVALASWREPVKWTEPSAPASQRRGVGGPGGGPGGPGQPPPQGGPGQFGGGRRQQEPRAPWMSNLSTPRSMRLLEIRRK